MAFDLGSVPSLTEQYATSGSGPLARAAFRCLCLNQVTRLGLADARPLLRVLFRARDPRVADLARRRLVRGGRRQIHDRLCSDLWKLLVDRRHAGRFRDMGFAAARYLLAPQSSFDRPEVRLVAALGHASSHERHAVADAVVDAAFRADDERVRQALTEVLAATDQSDLLDALHRVWWDECAKWSEMPGIGADPGGPLPLGVGLTAVTEVVRSNPERARWSPVTAAMLAVLEVRPYPVAGSSPSAYHTALTLSLKRSASAVLAQRCRAVLRRPWMADELCVAVLQGEDGESLAAWLEIGNLADEPPCRAAFYFWTRNWVAYDRLDPEGKLLRQFLADSEMDSGRRRLRKIAEAVGRPDPCPQDWIEQERERRRARANRHGPLGSWPTSPMSPGGHGFGTSF